MAIENFTLYTEVDPGSNITVAANSLTYILDNNTTAYIYSDKGAAYFDGDFSHYLKVTPGAAGSVNGITACWMLANVLNDVRSMQLAANNHLVVTLSKGSGTYTLALSEFYGTAVSVAASNPLSDATPYYLNIERDETVGTYGTLYCRIYSDDARTVLIETISLTLRNKQDFRYVYGLSSYNQSNPGRSSSGVVENLELSLNTLPVVDAGTDKAVKDHVTGTPFSDCSFSDADGTVVTARYKAVGEVDVWTEIPQGAYPTLLAAVQAFSYLFDNIGDITMSLQVEDDLGGQAEDSLTVTVEKYTKSISVTSSFSGKHLAGIYFDPGDGTGFALRNSPFSYSWEYGDFDVSIYRDVYNQVDFPLSVTDETSEAFSLSPVTIVNEIKGMAGINSESDELCIMVWLEQNGQMASSPTSCTVQLKDCDETVYYSASSTSHTGGHFNFDKTPSGMPVEGIYYIHATIVNNGVSISGMVAVGKLEKQNTWGKLLTDNVVSGSFGELIQAMSSKLNDCHDYDLGRRVLNPDTLVMTHYKRDGSVLVIFNCSAVAKNVQPIVERVPE